MVGGIATVIFMCGALAQLAIGRLVERFPLHLLFAAVAFLQFVGVVWAAYAAGPMLLLALAVAMAAIYAQVTVNDLVIARYTADAWRGRVYAVRYFLTFLVSGAAVSMIAILLQPRRVRPRARNDRGHRPRLRDRDRCDRAPGQQRREGAHARGGAGGVRNDMGRAGDLIGGSTPCGTSGAFIRWNERRCRSCKAPSPVRPRSSW